MPKIIQVVLEYFQIQSKACASLCFSTSPPRIGYLSLWMQQGLSHEIEASDHILHPLLVVIKCPSPGKTKFIKLPPSRAANDVKCPGYARGRMFKLRFDWYITLVLKSPNGEWLITCTFSFYIQNASRSWSWINPHLQVLQRRRGYQLSCEDP